jgi:hypothetical protein
MIPFTRGTASVADADDPLEVEARDLADQVVGRHRPQRAEGSGESSPLKGSAVYAGPGEPLSADVRQYFGQRLGFDFSGVRVHADDHAAESAKKFAALAYSVGRHVVFGRNELAASDPQRSWLTAHELTHVMQHAQGRSSSTVYRQPEAVQQPDRSEQPARSPSVPAQASAAISAEEESQFDDDAAKRASRSEMWDEVKAGALGTIYGAGQALAPGGFAAPSPAPKNRTFEFFRGAGQVATGITEMVTGAAGEVGGTALDLTGVGAPAGVAINVGSAAVIGQGAISASAGIGTLWHAMHMSGTPRQSWLPKKGTPERQAIENARARGIQRKMAQELADIKAGGKGSGVWTEEELKVIRETEEFPDDARWHHDPPVALRPDLADDPNVVSPVRGGHAGHLAAHGGSFLPKVK